MEVFAEAARQHIPAGLPLYIGGGCGLNCEWNARWRDLGHFSSVFVPPCPNDAGSGIGTAIDALAELTGDPHIDWNVYSGLDFEIDTTPDAARWERVPVDDLEIAAAFDQGRVFAWVQGRWEIGPRALGNRSLLADARNPAMKDRLNDIKQREDYGEPGYKRAAAPSADRGRGAHGAGRALQHVPELQGLRLHQPHVRFGSLLRGARDR
jgi:hydroxymethyl cephem carbamoyltransferase